MGLTALNGDLTEPPNQNADMVGRLDDCLAELRTTGRDVEDYANYCRRNRLVMDEHVLAQLGDAVRQAELRTARQRRVMAVPDGGGAARRLTEGEVVLRFGLATLAYVRGALEWCSPSYAQSSVAQFFDTEAQDCPTVNYERYEHRPMMRVERQLLDVFGLAEAEHGISVTSSGMAAFSLVESFLIRDRLKAGDRVLLSPYIYFESSEQLEALPTVTVHRAAGYGTADLLAAVREHRPRCVFADPVANTNEQRMIDLAALIAGLRSVVTERTTLVVDGTMLSGAMPAELLASDDLVEVLYYESGSKYLQLGLDAGMAGMVAYPAELRSRFELLRRNGGLILYRHGAELFPRYDRDFYRRRMIRIGANAVRMATLLQADPRVREAGRITHPGAPDHPDHEVARTWPYAGGCVTFLFHERNRNTKDELNAVFDRIMAAARPRGVQLTKGASFGFSAPRVSAADAFAEGEPPFLRLYVGDRADQLEALADIVAQALADTAEQALAS